MKNEDLTINQAIKELSISRSKLYGQLKQLGILATKRGRKSYLSLADIDRIKNCPNRPKTDQTDKKIKTLEKQLAEERENQKNLLVEIGRWQGRAKTLEEQNHKLLALQAPKEKPAQIGFFQRIFGKK